MKQKIFLFLIPVLILLSISFSPTSSVQDLINEVNSLRAENDLPSYSVNPTLMKIAQTHADYIASNGVLTHFNASGQSPYQRALDAGYSVAGNLSLGGDFAENIHSGANLSPEGAVTFWMGDSVQKAAMLSSDLQDVGAGMAIADGITYYVLNFGSESDTPAATSTPTRPSSEVVISTAGAFGTKEVIVYISTPQENGDVYHTVLKGEGLWSIAIAYGTTVEQIKLLNGLATDEIFAGQLLLVIKPITPTSTPTIESTATLGIPTSTATLPATATATSTVTPVPQAPTSLQNGSITVGIILLIALLGAGIGAVLGRKKRTKNQPVLVTMSEVNCYILITVVTNQTNEAAHD